MWNGGKSCFPVLAADVSEGSETTQKLDLSLDAGLCHGGDQEEGRG